jgi:2,4-dienoyl-CoA reductase-like NADH-dependent reductase (Old Yellow Enzyme family)
MKLANRFVRSATWEGPADADGAPRRSWPLYGEFAQAGLIISSHAFVSPEGRAGSLQLGAHDDSMIPGLRSVAAAVHEAGGKLALQIAHAGLWASPGSAPSADTAGEGAGNEAAQPLGPSVRQTETGRVGREMSRADIAAVTEAFAAAAGRAKAAGCDAVQIHGAHGYLLSEFFAAVQQTGRRVRRQRRQPDSIGRRGDRSVNGWPHGALKMNSVSSRRAGGRHVGARH